MGFQVVVAGGGWRNPVLMESIRSHLGRLEPSVSVIGHDSLGIPSDFKEVRLGECLPCVRFIVDVRLARQLHLGCWATCVSSVKQTTFLPVPEQRLKLLWEKFVRVETGLKC